MACACWNRNGGWEETSVKKLFGGVYHLQCHGGNNIKENGQTEAISEQAPFVIGMTMRGQLAMEVTHGPGQISTAMMISKEKMNTQHIKAMADMPDGVDAYRHLDETTSVSTTVSRQAETLQAFGSLSHKSRKRLRNLIDEGWLDDWSSSRLHEKDKRG